MNNAPRPIRVGQQWAPKNNQGPAITIVEHTTDILWIYDPRLDVDRLITNGHLLRFFEPQFCTETHHAPS